MAQIESATAMPVHRRSRLTEDLLYWAVAVLFDEAVQVLLQLC